LSRSRAPSSSFPLCPPAPPGALLRSRQLARRAREYNYRTAHIVWKLEGDTRGTSEEFIETAGFKDGKLLYKRFAAMNKYDQTIWAQRPPRKVDGWIICDQGFLYNIRKPLKVTYKRKWNLDHQMRVKKNLLWREMLSGIIQRPDLSQAEREAIKKRSFNLNDEELGKLGAKVTTDEFLGHKVKR
jgi:hypothetical protein